MASEHGKGLPNTKRDVYAHPFQKNPGTAAAAGYGQRKPFYPVFLCGLLAGTAAANFLHASLSDQAGTT